MSKPLINEKPFGSYPWYFRILFKFQQKKFGQVLLPTMVWSYVPSLSLAFLFFYQLFQRKNALIEPELRSLVMVRVAQVHACHFCIDANEFFLLQRTNNLKKAQEVSKWRTSQEFSDKERLALEYAEAMTQTECKVGDDLRDRLKSSFSSEQIVELTALIGFQNLSARFNSALAIPSQGLCKLED